MMETNTLEKIGLTHNESLVYLTLLKLGTSKSGDILNSSGINSGKIYEIFESLKKKGLVSESIINKVRNFTAAPPSQILYYLEKKMEEISKEEESIKKEIPQLEKLRIDSIKDIRAVTYLGYEGIKTAADEALASLKDNDEILAMGVIGKKHPRFNVFWRKWTEKRLKIKPKVIAKHIFSERGEYYNLFKKLRKNESKVLEGLTPVTVDIFGEEKVLILNYNEPYSCVMIYDKNTAQAFRTFFYQLWKQAKA